MNVLILGDGPEERAWAQSIVGRAGWRVVAVSPAWTDGLPDGAVACDDLDAGLAVAGLDAVLVGGPIKLRDEALRRVASVGLNAICLHPPGPNADPYYQVALSREETGAVVIPDLPGRLHPGVTALRAAIATEAVGGFRSLRIEAPGDPERGDLVATALPRWVDLVRVLLGEVDSITAMGEPPGPCPTRSLTVQLRTPAGRAAEIRLSALAVEPMATIAVVGESGSATLEVPSGWGGPSRLSRTLGGETTTEDLDSFEPREAILDVFAEAVAGRAVRPDLIDGTRAMELSTAVTRSLKKGRSVDLHYEVVSEANNFKTVMTSVGCMLLLGVLVALPIALAGPALGLGQTIYIAYLIPPVLVGFALVQLLKFGLKPAKGGAREKSDESVG